MLRNNSIRWARLLTLSFILIVQGLPAQNGPISGVYQITGGSYSECCGFGGNDFGYDLPNEQQSFVRFTVDPQRSLATMTFLAEDLRTVFSRIACPPGAINFSFNYGFVFSNLTVFHVDPGPPPYNLFWNYAVSNSAHNLRIDGVVGTAQFACADLPTRFYHSNVVAVLIPGPRLTIQGFSKDRGTQIMVQGNAGWTDVIEASTDLVTWIPMSTNFMDFSLCPQCPFVLFEDAASTNLNHRFYRAFEFK